MSKCTKNNRKTMNYPHKRVNEIYLCGGSLLSSGKNDDFEKVERIRGLENAGKNDAIYKYILKDFA